MTPSASAPSAFYLACSTWPDAARITAASSPPRRKSFATFGAELFSRPDINESEAMTELSLRINRGLIEISSGVRSCPAFIACYHEKFGTLCYTNAGHTPGLLRDANGIAELASDRPAAGTFLPRHHRRSHRGRGKRCRSAAGFSRSDRAAEGHHETRGQEFGLARLQTVFPVGAGQQRSGPLRFGPECRERIQRSSTPLRRSHGAGFDAQCLISRAANFPLQYQRPTNGAALLDSLRRSKIPYRPEPTLLPASPGSVAALYIL